MTHTLLNPSQMYLSGDELIISDTGNHRIIVATLKKGVAHVTKIIGSEKGYTDSDLAHALFSSPRGVIRVDEKVFVADTGNHCIRVINMKDNTVKTLLGNGTRAQNVCTKDQLSSPFGLSYNNGTLYISMTGTNQMWAYECESELLYLFAGTGEAGLTDGDYTEAQFSQPMGVTSDNEYLYVADAEFSAIRKIHLTSRQVDTLVGRVSQPSGYNDGYFQDALFKHPMGIHMSEGKLFVADTHNNAIRVLQEKMGITGTLLQREEKEETISIDISEPNDVIFDSGRLFICDTRNNSIKSIGEDGLFTIEFNFETYQ